MSSPLPEMPCAELVVCLTEYFEGALGAADRRRLEEHLAICADCRIYVEQLRETVRLAGELRTGDLDLAMRERLGRTFALWRAEA